MTAINELSTHLNTKTLNFVLLSFVTFGIYPLMWLYRKQGIIIDTTKVSFSSDLYVLWIAICYGISRQLSVMGTTDPEMYGYDPTMDAIAMLGGVLSIASAVMYIIWAFKARTALQSYVLNTFKFELKMNIFYLIIFNVFYITYCINAMPEAFAKHKIIQGGLTAAPVEATLPAGNSQADTDPK
ncbi:DUF4234 domain-containing protein [Kluyvera ascorbata]|uniref:DUF4234 domain-containing protein n=1 Tax=Kluyvera ascorbata TaxID=51288 RepID=UPI002068FD88|nr:DUF4234 domain-containing protein [Kluyvera ascorbata]UPQ70160.1 DUF4234 domain-containing protein [Kluyvera ascorbata]